MPIEIVLPRVDMGMESGVIGAWKVANGDRVREGQILFEINTDKAVMEIDAPASGVVGGITAEAGATLPVGTVVAMLYRDGETVSNAPPPANQPSAAKSNAKPRATPMARRLARNAGFDLNHVAGSGPRGRVVRADVEKHAAQSRPEARIEVARAGKLVPFDAVRRITAQRLTESVRTAPHFYLTAHLDMSACNDLRRKEGPRIEQKYGTRLSLTMILLRIVAPLLVEHPRLNASTEGEAVRYHDRVDIGVAMDRDGGLVVPVLRDVQRKSLDEIARDFAKLTASVRDRTIAPADLSGGTFTISNLGMYGVDAFTAIINPPEAAILAVGRSVDTPVGRDGRIELRPMAAFCLSSDHRIVDGLAAARFMSSLRDAVENPRGLP